MSEADNFLTRWSRRKAEQRQRAEQEHEARGDNPSPEATAPPMQEDVAKPAEGELPTGAPAFDPASLPAIDSITATTDIRGFLQPGVPAELRNAALRRAWSIDPAIRDFRGLQENDWDFNDPNGITGFGPLSPDFDAGKMASALFGDASREDADGTSVQEERSQHAGTFIESSEDALPESSGGPQGEIVQREVTTASQDQKTKSGEPRPLRRRGGALPQT